MSNVVVLEIAFAIGLVLLAIENSMVTLYVAAAITLIGLLVAAIRWRGRWFTQWIKLTLQYAFRSHTRVSRRTKPVSVDSIADEEGTPVTGPDDPRVSLLRLAVPDLVVAHGMDHERHPLGLAWHQSTWTAVLLVDPAPALVSQVGSSPNLPLGALAPCLEDRGVVLDGIQVIWHCYPGSAALPANSPALASYMEVLGPLPAAARRTTWVAVRLDP
ncbi:MAG: type VII secretion protein EccE, partial [Actinophytocola sp.]